MIACRNEIVMPSLVGRRETERATRRFLRAVGLVTVLLWIVLSAGCGETPLPARPELPTGTQLTIDPAEPSMGEVVRLEVTYESEPPVQEWGNKWRVEHGPDESIVDFPWDTGRAPSWINGIPPVS